MFSTGQWSAARSGVIAAVAAMLILSGCATPPPAGHGIGTVHTGGSDARRQLIHVTRQAIGTPYRYGGSSPDGFDCSGLVQFAHRQVGLDVPRTTASQWRHARTPDRRHLLPGDLLFFELGGRKDRHVAIYEGGGRFIHAPSSGKRVRRASLDNPYWHSRLVGKKTFL